MLVSGYAFGAAPYSSDEYLALRRKIGLAQYQAAREECLRMMDTYPHDAVLHETFVEICLYAGQIEEAETVLRRRLAAGSSVEQCLYAIGLSRYHRQLFRDALDAFTRAIKLGNSSPDCYKYLAYTIEKLYGVDEAIRRLSLMSHEESSNSSIWYSLGLSYWAKQDYFQSARAFGEAVARDPSKSSFRYSLAAVKALSGELKQPIVSFTRLLNEAEASGNIFDKQFIRSYLLMFRSANGDDEGWRALIDRCRSEAREYGLVRWLGWIQARLSDAALQQGRLDDALAEANIAIQSSRLSQEADYFLSASKTQFDAHILRGDFGRALKAVSDLMERIPFKVQRLDSARVLIESGYVLNEIRRSKMALDVIVDGVDRANRAKMDPSILFFAETNLGTIYENLHDTLSAFRSFQHATNSIANSGFRKKNMPVAAGNLSRLYMMSGEFGKADQLIQIEDSLATSCGSKIEKANACFNRGEYFQGKNLSRLALPWFQKCDSLAASMNSLPLQIDVKRRMAWTSFLTGDRIGAREQNQSLAELYDTLACRIPPFISGAELWSLDPYRFLISEAVRTRNLLEAIGWFEKCRFSASRRVRSYNLLAKESAFAADLEVRQALLGLANSKVVDGQFGLPNPAEKSRAAMEFVKNAALASDFWVRKNIGVKLNAALGHFEPKELQKALGKEEVLLALSTWNDNLSILFATADTISLFQIHVPKPGVAELVARVTSNLDRSLATNLTHGMRYTTDVQNPYRELFHLVFDSISSIIHDKTHLIVVPDGMLSNIPFELLTDRFGRLLIEEHFISYQLSLSDVISRNSELANQTAEMLFVGNDSDGSPNSLVFDRRYLTFSKISGGSFLPGVRKELEELHIRLGNRFDEITNGLATKSRVLTSAPGYTVVHVAAHGRPIAMDPISSSIVISAEATPFGEVGAELTPLDIASRQWDSELIFLSACGTAEGGPEGISDGFLSAFKSSGVDCIIASLGDVDDRVTANLVGKFYSNLAIGIPSVDALRNAKLSLAKEGIVPQLWAPFVMYGTSKTFGTFTSRHRSGEWDSVSILSIAVYCVAGSVWLLVHMRRRIRRRDVKWETKTKKA